MPFNGSGTFVRLYSWVNDAANNIDISAPEMDNEFNGMAAALSDCLTRDGQSTWNANQPAAGFKVTGLGNGTASTDSAAFGQVTSAVSTGAPLRKNWLTNAAFQLNQRFGALGGLGLAATRAYALDRWYGAYSLTTGTISQVTGIGLSQFEFGLQVQRTNGQVNLGTMQVGQSLETLDSYQLQGQQVTLSFWARAGANFSAASSILNASVYTGTGTDQNFLNGGYTGSAQPLNQNATLTTSWQRFSYTATLAGGITEVSVAFSATPTGTAGGADYYQLAGVQLEPAAQVTDFDFQPFQAVLARCQRFYQKTFALGTVPVQASGILAGAVIFTAGKAGANPEWFGVTYPVPMRIAPTVVYLNYANGNLQVHDATAGADCSATANTNPAYNLNYISCTGAAGTAVGNLLAVHYTADGEMY